MKRKYILPAVAGLTLALASCSNTPEESTTQGEETSSFDRSLLGGLAIDQSMFLAPDLRFDTKEVKELKYTIAEELSPGFFLLEDDKGKLSIYSAQLEKVIFKDFDKIDDSSNSYQRFYASCIIGDRVITIDQYGNELLNESYAEDKQIVESLYLVNLNNKFYYNVLYNNDERVLTNKYFELDSNLKTKEISALPNELPADPTKDYDGPKVNEIFSLNRKEISDKRYVTTSLDNNYKEVVNLYENDTLIKSFTSTKSELNTLLLVGNKLLKQEVNELSSDAKEYDTLINGKKLNVKQTLIDLLTLEEKEVKMDYLVFSCYELAGGETNQSFTIKDGSKEYLTCAAIKKGSTFDGDIYYYEGLVIDSDLNILEKNNLTNLLGNIRLGDSYLSLVNLCLYDSQMNPVADLNNLEDISIDYKNNLIYGMINGKWGIVGTDGKVKAEFIYDNLKPLEDDYDEDNDFLDVKDDCIIALRDGYYYRVNVKTGETKLLGNNVDTLYNMLNQAGSFPFEMDDLYTLTLDDKLYVMSQSKIYFEFNMNNGTGISDVNVLIDEVKSEIYVLIDVRQNEESGEHDYHYKITLNALMETK